MNNIIKPNKKKDKKKKKTYSITILKRRFFAFLYFSRKTHKMIPLNNNTLGITEKTFTCKNKTQTKSVTLVIIKVNI